MGLDSNGTKFLFAAHAAGVSFRQTAMLGRQNFFPEPAQLQRLLDLRQSGLSAVEFLADSQSYAEKFLEFLGAEEAVAIDNSAYEGAAIVTDLNAPIDASFKERFSVVLDGGCLEHIFNFPQAIRNCMEMLEVGGHFLGITPANNFCGHGFYQFSPELYFRIFTEENGFALRAVLTTDGSTGIACRIPTSSVAGSNCKITGQRIYSLWRKKLSRELFVAPPQQSDYARTWQGSSNATIPSGRSLGTKLRALLLAQARDALRPLAAHLPIGHRYSCYQRLDEAALLRGELESRPTAT